MREADVVVCPSRDETMPIVLLEAMSMGKADHLVRRRRDSRMDHGWRERPARARAGYRRSGLGDASALVSEPDLRAHLGAAGRETYEQHFTIDRLWRALRRCDRADDREPPRGAIVKPGSYEEWVRRYDTLTPADRLSLKDEQQQLAQLAALLDSAAGL